MGDVTWTAAPGAGSVDGSGTANTIPRWTDSDTIGDSIITVPSNTSVQVTIPNSGGVTKQLVQKWTQTLQNTFLLNMYGGATDLVQLAATNAEQNISIVTEASGSLSATTSKGIYIKSGGNVGIGTVTPATELHAHGTTLTGRTTGTTGSYVLNSYDLVLSNGNSGTVILLYNNAGAFHSGLIKYDTNCLKLGLNNSNSTNAILTTTAVNVGSVGVGIGTDDPGSKLEVYAASGLVASHVKSGTVISRLTANSTASDGVVGTSSAHDFLIQRGGATKITVAAASTKFADSVGIDVVPNAANKLEVNGQARATTAMFGNSSVSNVAAKPIHIKYGGTAELRLEDSTSSNYVYDISADFTNGFRITDVTSTLVPFTIAKTSGNVGIGTDAPAATLQVNKTAAGEYMRVGSGATRELTFTSYTAVSDHAGHKINASSGNGEIRLQTNTADRLTITSGGNVGIGTVTPGAPLHVYSNGTTNTPEPILCLGSNTSNIPVLQFSESVNAGFNTGMSIQYRGDYGAGDANALGIHAIGADATTSGAAVATFKSGGKVGIGTTDPTEILEVVSDSDPTILIRPVTVDSANSGKISYRENAGGTTGVDLRYDGANNRFSIDTSDVANAFVVKRTDGNVGIGTDNPSSILHLYHATSPKLLIQDTTNNVKFMAYAQNSNVHIGTNSAHDLYIDVNTSTNAIHILQSNGTVDIASSKMLIGGSAGTDGYVLTTDGAGGIAWEASPGAGSVDGSGTANKVAKWTDSDTVGDSQITDNGTSVGINQGSPNAANKLEVHNGNITITSGKQLISTNSYTQVPPGMLTTQGPSTGATTLGTGTWGIMMGPQHTRSTTANTYYPGIAFNHLLNNGGAVTYNNHPQAWIGTRLHDTPGSERAFLVFSTKSGTGVTASDVPVERMCIDPVYGSVGIGATDPNSQLQVQRAQTTSAFTDAFLKLTPTALTNTTGLTSIALATSTVDNYGYSISGWRAGTDGSPHLAIKYHNNSAAGVDVMAMDSSGHVGIGTNDPAYILDVYETGSNLGIFRSTATNYARLVIRSWQRRRRSASFSK